MNNKRPPKPTVAPADAAKGAAAELAFRQWLGVGPIAFDTKAKTIYREGLIFDLDEVRRLRVFARQFHLTVFFACLDPAGGDMGFWVRLDQLDFARVTVRGGVQTVCCHTDNAMPFSMQNSFYDAFIDAMTKF